MNDDDDAEDGCVNLFVVPGEPERKVNVKIRFG